MSTLDEKINQWVRQEVSKYSPFSVKATLDSSLLPPEFYDQLGAYSETLIRAKLGEALTPLLVEADQRRSQKIDSSFL